MCIYLAVLSLGLDMQDLQSSWCLRTSWGIWYLILQTGIEPQALALGAWSFSHWTTREVIILR